jgi:metal-responsive CopG/Arc/MetJ family transcriptional regulator
MANRQAIQAKYRAGKATVQIELPKELLVAFDEIVGTHKQNRSEVIRLMMESFVGKYGNESTETA